MISTLRGAETARNSRDRLGERYGKPGMLTPANRQSLPRIGDIHRVAMP
jgi:hypothetical protein